MLRSLNEDKVVAYLSKSSEGSAPKVFYPKGATRPGVGGKVHYLLANSFGYLFCLDFSVALDTPQAMHRAGQAYLKSALGQAEALYCHLIEPVVYGEPLLFYALTEQGSSVLESAEYNATYIPYALSAWNEYANAAEDGRVCLMVIEPNGITAFMSGPKGIIGVATKPTQRVPSASDVADLMRSLFAWDTEATCIVDEFGLLQDATPSNAKMLCSRCVYDYHDATRLEGASGDA